MKRLIISAIALVAITSGAFAGMPYNRAVSQIAKIIEGHGHPGDTAVSRSNPDIRVRVLKDGRVERTNSRYGTVSIIDPAAERKAFNIGR